MGVMSRLSLRTIPMAKIPANETPEQRMKRLDREASRTYVARRLGPTANHLQWYKQSLQTPLPQVDAQSK